MASENKENTDKTHEAAHQNQVDQAFFMKPQEITVLDFNCAESWILDIGGGGEGIIGQIKGKQVVAIDLQKRELEETRNEALKIVMDARDLQFLDETFETITAFFTLMYIAGKRIDLEQIFHEIVRVLKPGGKLLVWDVIFDPPEFVDKKIIAFHLKVNLPDGTVNQTGYGAKMHAQKMEDFVNLADINGLTLVRKEVADQVYFLEFQKT
ncbi:MAG: class I SAM-dependent methyltransferase [Promethearchaeota archaeon]